MVNRRKELDQAKTAENQQVQIENVKFGALLEGFWELLREEVIAAIEKYNRLLNNTEQALRVEPLGASRLRINAPPAESGRPAALEIEIVPNAHLLKCRQPYSNSQERLFRIDVYADGLFLVQRNVVPDSEISKVLLEEFLSHLQGIQPAP